MPTARQHANAQLLAIKKIQELLSNFKNYRYTHSVEYTHIEAKESVVVSAETKEMDHSHEETKEPAAKVTMTKEIQLVPIAMQTILDALQGFHQQGMLRWEMGDTSDEDKINGTLRYPLTILCNTEKNTVFSPLFYEATHKSLLILSTYWPKNKFEKDATTEELYLESPILFEPVTANNRIPDSVGYVYNKNEILQLQVKDNTHPFNNIPFSQRDVKFFRAVDFKFFRYTKQYAMGSFVLRVLLPSMTLILAAFIIMFIKVIALHAIFGFYIPLVLLAGGLCLFLFTMVASLVLGAFIGLVKDCYIAATRGNAYVEVAQLLDSIDSQARLAENDNPFFEELPNVSNASAINFFGQPATNTNSDLNNTVAIGPSPD